MSYLAYYNLKREPFSNAPDRRFFFPNEKHEQALKRLFHAAHNQRGLALCTGPIGHGKTTLARRLYDILPETEFHKALLVVIHSDVTSDWLLMKIAKLLGVSQPKTTKVELLGQIYLRLRAIDKAGRKTVILIDEAQMLSGRNLMEEFRGLLNIELKARKLINFIFFGLPGIEDSLRQDEPLRQRVAVRVLLEPYTFGETRSYITHRLQVAGGMGKVFSPEIIEKIHVFSNGTPRLINTLCDNLMLEGFLTRKAIIEQGMVDALAKAFDLVPKTPSPVEQVPQTPALMPLSEPEKDGWTLDPQVLDELVQMLDK